jgi:hypothetical protein
MALPIGVNKSLEIAKLSAWLTRLELKFFSF